MPDLRPLTRVALKLDPLADEITVAEAVWLAAHRNLRSADPGSASPTAERPAVAPSTAIERTSAPVKLQPAEPVVALYAPAPGPRRGGLARTVVIKPPPALPQSLRLARSLRPFARLWPGGPRTRLDVDATVRQYARTGQVQPLFQPWPERWFEALVLVDSSPGMVVWEDVIGEFVRVLRVAGAFRAVHRLGFDPVGEPGVEPSGGPRRMVFVVSDCAAAPWQGSSPWHALRSWAGTQPTVLINPLPARMWDHAGLDLPAARLFAERPGLANRALNFRLPPLCRGPGRDPDWVPIPVAGLTPHSLGRLAAALMRNDPTGCEAVLTTAAGRSAADVGLAAEPNVEALVTAFRRMASPSALRLAVLVAMWERLPLQILRVVAEHAVPEAGVSDLGEVMASGLFVIDGPVGSPMLAFRRGVREMIQRDLRVDDVLRVYHLVSQNGPTGRGFRALFAEAGGPVVLPHDTMAFGVLSREAIDILGLQPSSRRAAGSGLPPAQRSSARPGGSVLQGSPSSPTRPASRRPTASPSRPTAPGRPIDHGLSGSPGRAPASLWPTIADIELEGWDGYDPSALSRERYDRLRSVDGQIIRIVADHFVQVAPQRWRERAVSIGDGVNLYPALLMLPFAGSVTLLERSFVNREWLYSQVRRPNSSWWEFWQAISDGRGEYSRIRKPFDQLGLRSYVSKGNVFSLRPQSYDIGTMFFVAERATTRNDEFERATRLFIGSLRHRAPFAATFHRDSPTYTMGGRRLSGCPVDVDDVRNALRDIAIIEDISVVHDPDAEAGEGDVIVVVGRGR